MTFIPFLYVLFAAITSIVWMGLALGAVLSKMGMASTRAWIPVLRWVAAAEAGRTSRTAVLIARSVSAGGVVLLLAGLLLRALQGTGVTPVAGYAVLVGAVAYGLGAFVGWIFWIIGAGTIGMRLNISGAWVVLAALSPNLWAAIVGWANIGTPIPSDAIGRAASSAAASSAAARESQAPGMAAQGAPVGGPTSVFGDGRPTPPPPTQGLNMKPFASVHPDASASAAPVPPAPPAPPASPAATASPAPVPEESAPVPPAPSGPSVPLAPPAPYSAPPTDDATVVEAAPVVTPPPVSPYISAPRAEAADVPRAVSPYDLHLDAPEPEDAETVIETAHPAPPIAVPERTVSTPEPTVAVPEGTDSGLAMLPPGWAGAPTSEVPSAPSPVDPPVASPAAPSATPPPTRPAPIGVWAAPGAASASGADSQAFPPAPAAPAEARGAETDSTETDSAETDGAETDGAETDGADDHTVIAQRRREVWVLEVVGGDSYPLPEGQVTIGRAAATNADSQHIGVVDATRTMSKRHAALRLDGGSWKVSDLGSTNGTYLRAADGREVEVTVGNEVTVDGVLLLGDLEANIVNQGASQR